MGKQVLKDLHEMRRQQREGRAYAPAPSTPKRPYTPRKAANYRAEFMLQNGLMTATSLVMPFPFSDTRSAQVVIPRDMTKKEAERICAFVQTLASP